MARPSGLAWLYAPSPASLLFAVRTTAAAIISLLIAMWMELDSPQWSAMTVWIVAQNSRGESLSKSRWRVVGTAVGVVMAVLFTALFPQQPFLFLPAIALWLGLCCTVATMVRNFRAYAAVLAGYSCAIVGLAAASNPNDIFTVAVSRSTYIMLGIVVEGSLAALFAINGETQARIALRAKLTSAMDSATDAVAHVLDGGEHAFQRSRALFGTILTINDQIEFTEVEMGHHGSEGDHARAALAAVSVLLSRALGMATRMAALPDEQSDFRATAGMARDLMRDIPPLLAHDEGAANAMVRVRALQDQCRARITAALGEELPPQGGVSEEHMTMLLDRRVLHQALWELLDDLYFALREFHASTRPDVRDHFHFRLPAPRDYTEALHNGIRATASITVASLIWEVTAWSSGLGFITIISLTVGLFATRENPVIATSNFFRGTVAAAIVAGIMSLWVVPAVNDPTTLAAVLAVPMIVGGLAARNASTALAAAAYNIFTINMISPLNGGRETEIAYFNSAVATVLGAGCAVLIFRMVLPFNTDSVRWRMRGRILGDLRRLAASPALPDTRRWVGYSADRMARVVRHAGPAPAPVIEAYLQGTLAAMTIGLNVIRLRHLHARQQLPPSARRPVEVVLRRMTQFTGRYGRTAAMAHAATRILRQLEIRESDIEKRLEMTRAIAYLLVISNELDQNADFLNAQRPYRRVDGA
ncbi:FUSC family protein [Ameyamaea chiangmaiensis]|uniref:FUSC family protein n=1 Tax=Ameyamaea chiangmaiensis TaxID=442969 RepID=A0A850P9M2_9PROT|nr:FUSC family protein [Ameyamaea chiangmaiensis]MBS4074476.1 FUSC family protein [Ameyamaea chiangmaiensis]NVN39260.1 FUSC family protein [Ameyamaea chiangmaiensis]